MQFIQLVYNRLGHLIANLYFLQWDWKGLQSYKNSCLRNQRWKIIIACKSKKDYKTHPQNFQRKKVRLWAWMGYKYPIQQLCSCEEHVMMGIKTKENKRMNNISCRSKKNNLLDACALLWWLKEGNFLNISPKCYNCTWHQAAGAKSGKKPEL